MKQQILLLFSLLLLSFFLGSSNLLVLPKGPKQGEMELNVMNDEAIVQSYSELKDEMEQLMGSVECYEKDEECYSRRMIAEAHLDYIYTQQTTP